MLFVGIGAGMGADSGLKVFKEIADVPAYQKRKLVYSGKLNGLFAYVFLTSVFSAICQPDWVEREPDTFYGVCFSVKQLNFKSPIVLGFLYEHIS